MRALLHNAAVLQHHNQVGLLHGGKAVGDYQGGAARHGGFECGLHHALALCVQRAGGFVQQQQGRILQDGARDRNALALAARQAHASLPQKGVVALGQGADELVGKGGFGSGHHFIRAGFRLAVADVFQRAAGENYRVLRHDADAPAQVVQRQRPDVGAVQADGSRVAGVPGVRIVKTQQQLEHRALACAAGTDQRDRLARTHLQAEAGQCCGRWSGRVMKRHCFKIDSAPCSAGADFRRIGW